MSSAMAEMAYHSPRTWYHNQFDLPKGNRSRYVDMSQQLKAVLQFAQTVRGESDLLFPGPNGQPIGASSFTKNWFRPTLRTAELEGFAFHDLRHSFGSLLLDAGAPLAYVSEQDGPRLYRHHGTDLHPIAAQECRIRESP